MKLIGKSSFDYRAVLNRLKPLVLRFHIIIISVVVLALFAFAILRVDSLSSAVLNEERYNEALVNLNAVTFDEEAVEQINALRDAGVDIGSEFIDRDNPFIE